MAENYYYVLNAGKNQSETLNHTYAQRDAAYPSTAFFSTSVNPIIKNPGIPSSGNFAGVSGLSANFFEIRIAPYDLDGNGSIENKEPMISGDSHTGLVNRIHPAGYSDTITDANHISKHASNLQDTKSNRIRLKTETGGTLAVGSNGLNMDINNFDYFVLINPEVTGNDGIVSIRPHFAKIKDIIQFDNYGDGIEFEPRYPSPIPKGTKFEIYKGPNKANTNVVAVSYGLRGNTTSSSSIITDKYDVSNVVSRPTWYFYEDRLVNKNQLDYDTKYQLTSCRFFKNWTSLGGTGLNTSDGTYHTNTIASSVLNDTNLQGHTIWGSDGSGGGIKRNIGNLVSAHPSAPVLDDVKYDIPTASDVIGGATAFTLYYGRTVCQSVFLTEPEYGTIISDLGSKGLDAEIVDNMKEKDRTEINYETGSASAFDPIIWKSSFPNYKRNSSDRNVNHSSYSNNTNYTHVHADLVGPKRYLHYQSSHMKNNGIPATLHNMVNLPRNKASQLARASILDNNGICFLKLKKGAKYIVRNNVKTGVFGAYKLPFSATSSVVGGAYTITLNQISDAFDCRDDSFIKIGDSLIVRGHSYIISAIAAPNTTSMTQSLTVNKIKRVGDSTYSTMSSIDSFTLEDIYINTWNGLLVGDLPIDTEAVYSNNVFQRLTINGNTISKDKTNLSKSKLTILSGEFSGIDIPIDYGNSITNHIKLKQPNKQMYIPDSIASSNNPSFINYITGSYGIDEEIFSGTVEDTYPKLIEGTPTYEITGRDGLSRLLDNTVSKNLGYTNELLYSSLIPMFDSTLTVDVSGTIATGSKTFNTVSSPSSGRVNASSLKKYDLLFNAATMKLIGEVQSTSGTTVTMSDNALISGNNNIPIKAVSLSDITTNKFYLSGVKSINTNPMGTSKQTDLVSAGDKGLVFIDGDELIYDTNRGQSTKNLAYTSSQGSYQEDKSLGYDVTNVRGITDNDSRFAFKLGDESTPIVTEKSKIMPSSTSYFSILDISEKTGADTTITVAPTFPVVLGSIELNSSDTRFNNENEAYIYFLNTNIPYGGYIHKLKGVYGGENYTPSLTFKYHDLQRFSSGTLSIDNSFNSHKSIYNNLRDLSISGASPAYGIKGYSNTLYNTAEMANLLTNDMNPIEGSNIINSDYNEFYKEKVGNYKFKLSDNSKITPPNQFVKGLTVDTLVYAGGDMTGGSQHANNANLQIQASMVTGDGPGDVVNNGSNYLVNIDPKVKNYELMAIGDIYPESILRHNHLGFSSKPFASYGMLLESNPTKGSSVSHSNYTGSSKETILKDSSYQTANITSASISTNQIKRWGVMRLVEATYDWHFNPVDAETMPKTSTIPELQNFQYWRFSEPVQPTTGNGTAITYVDTDYDEGEIFFKTNTNAESSSNRQTVTFEPFDILYNATTGSIIGMYKGTANVSLYGSNDSSNYVSGNWILLMTESSNMPLYVLRQEKVTMLSQTYGLSAPNNIQVLAHRWPGLMPFNLYSDTGNGIDTLAENPIKMTNVYLAREPIDKDYFDYNTLTGGVDQDFDPQNILIPLISRVDRNKNSTEKKYYAISAWHDSEQWEHARANFASNDAPTYYHISRVMDALAQETFDADLSVSNQNTKPREYLMGLGHIYDNCTAIFRDIKNSIGSMEYNLDNTSAPLDLASLADYTTFDPHTAEDEQDQHGLNVMIKRKGKNASFVGTRTVDRILKDEEGRASPTRTSRHQANNTNTGELFNAQMFVKPKFNLLGATSSTLASKGYTHSDKTLTFSMNDNSTHSWLAFVNNLEGYYLVSDKLSNSHLPYSAKTTTTGALAGNATSIPLTDASSFPSSGKISMYGHYHDVSGNDVFTDEIITYTGKSGNTLTGCVRNIAGNGVTDGGFYETNDSATTVRLITDVKEGTPVYISRITSHSVISESAASAIDVAGASAGSTSPRTKHTIVLDKTLNLTTHGHTFRLMRIADTTFDDTPGYFKLNHMFDTGLQYDKTTDNLLTASAGTTNEYSENIYSMFLVADIDTKNDYLERRELSNIDMFTNGTTYDCYITDGNVSQRKSLTYDSSQYRFNYEGELNGVGMVSFGETFTLTSSSDISIEPERLYIGVTASFGTDATVAIEEILEENSIDTNLKNKNITYTGNIVSSVSGANITLQSNASGLLNNDFIYTQDGEYIGQIASISNNVITIKDADGDSTYDLYTTPVANDEITLYTKKPFVLTTNFNESNVFNSINHLSSKAGLEYIFNDKKIELRDMDNYQTKRTFSLKYNNASNLISVENNESLFDEVSKVIVIGDRVKATVEDPSANVTRTIKHIDSNIKDVKEAKVKAEQILEIHRQAPKKITLKMQKKGYETMKPGDLISLDFPNHNIPADDYIVFEIENALQQISSITVGTYNKQIAERLTELQFNQSDGFTNILTSNSTVELTTRFLDDELIFRNQSLTYRITEAGGGAMGYGTPMGYTSTVNYGVETTTETGGI